MLVGVSGAAAAAHIVIARRRPALGEGRSDEAKQKAVEALELDASNADAVSVRDEADAA